MVRARQVLYTPSQEIQFFIFLNFSITNSTSLIVTCAPAIPCRAIVFCFESDHFEVGIQGSIDLEGKIRYIFGRFDVWTWNGTCLPEVGGSRQGGPCLRGGVCQPQERSSFPWGKLAFLPSQRTALQLGYLFLWKCYRCATHMWFKILAVAQGGSRWEAAKGHKGTFWEKDMFCIIIGVFVTRVDSLVKSSTCICKMWKIALWVSNIDLNKVKTKGTNVHLEWWVLHPELGCTVVSASSHQLSSLRLSEPTFRARPVACGKGISSQTGKGGFICQRCWDNWLFI